MPRSMGGPGLGAVVDSEGAMDTRTGESAMQGLPEGHPAVKSGRIGVLLLNLGTPDGTAYGPMRRREAVKVPIRGMAPGCLTP